jgi:diguanylate cyclase (GGDEF)-like protein
MALATLVGLAASLLSWKSRSIVSSWMMAASIPPFLVLMRLMAESFGLVPTMWEMRVVLSVVLAVTVPLLLYALSVVTHDRKEIRVRANHLPTQDALTGLLNAETFLLQLEEACNRVNGHQEKVGVVLVDLVNYELIREKFGDTLGEQCLLRSVVKLQRVLRDMDPAGRMGRARFGLILQGVADKDLLTERMVKLVASGHIPIPGLVPAIALQFQAACALLHLTPMSAQDMVQSLSELLNGMSAGTRRPIRFAETVNTIRLDPPSVPPPQDLASQPVA